MRKTFSWDRFDLAFLKAILFGKHTKSHLQPTTKRNDKDLLLPYMDRIAARPDTHFIRNYREEITEHFFKGSPRLVSLIRALEKKKYHRADASVSIDEMLEQFKRMRLTDTVLRLVMKELMEEGSAVIFDEDAFTIFNNPKTIDVTACVAADLPMYPYQTEAIDKLQEHFIMNNERAGILSMPTGSGKTRTATKFLSESVIPTGRQVIWLTHRAQLIEQTAYAFYTYTGSILHRIAPTKDTFRMVCVSGSHTTIRAIDHKDDVQIFSVQSLVRNLPFLQAAVRNRVMIVIDEAHHALAPSYRAIIKEIERLSTDVKLFGLTATPRRINDIETNRLLKLFDNNIIYTISLSTLIAQGYLSIPKYEKIDTNLDFKQTITLDEQAYIRKWGELSPATMEKIARVAERNALIVDTYLKNKEKYGKTLIFALNATHCISLCEELQKHGVRCDYIYSAHEGTAAKIAAFKRGELDVLVNITIMTEGTDVPDIETVFLTRPTASDVLLMQMLGRGLRGVSSGGTEFVNIVDFHDLWGAFANWINPQTLIENEFGIDLDDDNDAIEVEPTPSPSPESEAEDTDETADSRPAPWEMLQYLFNSIHIEIVSTDHDTAQVSMPVGWFDLIDEDGNDTKVLVFESQLKGYLAMRKDSAAIMDDPDYTGAYAFDKHFSYFGLLPTVRDLQLVIDTYRIAKEYPHLFLFANRKEIDAASVAQTLRDENVGLADLTARIHAYYTDHTAMIDSIYGGRRQFEERVKDFLFYPNGIKPLGMRVEELPDEELPYSFTPCHDLQELTNEVVTKMFHDEYGELPPIKWTDRPLKSYFGCYYYDNPRILINAALNSESVPSEVVKYVIYHELLHRDYHNHGKAFREQEHKYPDWTKHEKFLDDTFPKFDLDYAM